MGGSRTWSARSVPDCTRRRKTPRYLVLSNGCSRSIPPAVMLYLSQYTMGSLVPSFRGVVIAVCRCPSVWGWPPSPHRVQADNTTSTAHGKQQQPASPMQICSDFREYQTGCDPVTQPQPNTALVCSHSDTDTANTVSYGHIQHSHILRTSQPAGSTHSDPSSLDAHPGDHTTIVTRGAGMLVTPPTTYVFRDRQQRGTALSACSAPSAGTSQCSGHNESWQSLSSSSASSVLVRVTSAA